MFLNHLIAQCLPLVPKPLVKPFARRYVAGETIEEMLSLVRQFHHQGLHSTVDLLGEFIHHPSEARMTAEAYKTILKKLHDDPEQLNLSANVSVKLTALGLLLDKDLCYDLIHDIVATALAYQNFVRIDMEDSTCTEDTILIYLKLRQEFTNVGIVLQAYMRRTLEDARRIMNEDAGHFRLCKGIYIEPYDVAFQDKEIVHKNYAMVLEEMLRHKAYVGIATHHEELVWEAHRLIDQYKLSQNEYEFQMLLGVAPELRERLLKAGHKVRIYVPYGKDWYAYSLRRLKENPRLITHVLKNVLNKR